MTAAVNTATVMIEAIIQPMATRRPGNVVGAWSPPPDCVMVEADHHRLAQVLGNLLSNALKFTPEGGLVSLVVHGDRERVTFGVADTGAGISREHQAHIFDRFWQAPSRKRDGVGLGLAIVKGIVDAHGGTIDVDSELGKGTTFRVTLPRQR